MHDTATRRTTGMRLQAVPEAPITDADPAVGEGAGSVDRVRVAVRRSGKIGGVDGGEAGEAASTPTHPMITLRGRGL